MNTVYTIGHSSLAMNDFVKLLRCHNIEVIADVRSMPFSRLYPHFNRDILGLALRENGVKYVFLGKELGARPNDRCCFVGQRVSYERLADTALFRKGIDRVKSGAAKYRVALLCAEKDPITCHRTVLVAKVLQEEGLIVKHIIESGGLESQEQLEHRLLREFDLHEEDMFRSQTDRLAAAYKFQEEKIAYVATEQVYQERAGI